MGLAGWQDFFSSYRTSYRKRNGQTTTKTKSTKIRVGNFIAAVENDSRREDAKTLLKLFEKATGWKAQMWGPTIVGFGAYHYTYDTGHSGSICVVGFSPRKASLKAKMVIYVFDFPGKADLLQKLGKHKGGLKQCLYINRLADVDLAVLETLMYGTGMRLMECLRLRIKDVDFAAGEIVIREGKGDKDRRTMLPEKVKTQLKEHLERVRRINGRDLNDGYGRAPLPHALNRKYPNASAEWAWQYVFPQSKRWVNGRTGEQGRHHVDESIVQKAIKAAVRKAEIGKPATSHTLRHSFTTHLLEDGL